MRLPLPSNPRASALHLDWTRAYDPVREPQVRDLLDAVEKRLARRLRDPGQLLSDLSRCFTSAALPETHLPWYWDTVGHRLAVHEAKRASAAYRRAREAEDVHALPVDPGHAVDNARLFARHGALSAKELVAHQHRLTALLPTQEAHREFVGFLEAWAGGPAPIPAGLPARLRASLRSVGLGAAEESRALSRILTTTRGNDIPPRVVEAATRAFTAVAPPVGDRARLADLFPNTETDGAEWLRLLEAIGITGDLAQARIRPADGFGGWLSRYFRTYGWVRSGRYSVKNPMPEELYALLPRIAPHVIAEGAPVPLYQSKFARGYGHVNERLVLACESLGITVDLPANAERPTPSRPAHVGPRPAPEIVERTTATAASVRGAPLGQAQQALTDLDECLTHDVMRGLEEVQDLLDGLDLAEPLARTLRFGVPGELGWPAFEEAAAEIGAREGGIAGMTSTWPVLTVYGHDAAVAVDHRGRRGACVFTLPEDADRHTVHFVGGDFQVGWTVRARDSRDGQPTRALWTSRPDDVFTTESPVELFRGGTWHSAPVRLVMSAPDGGRYDEDGILRPGTRRGVTRVDDTLGDGSRLWSSTGHGHHDLVEIHPETGARGEVSWPDFLRPDPDLELLDDQDTSVHLVRLPDGVASPLGARDGLAGFRLERVGPPAEGARRPARALRGTDGRRAEFVDHYGLTYWGLVRLPASTADGLVGGTGYDVIQCRDARDDALIWEARTYPRADSGPHRSGDAVERRAFLPLVPPPAYWHFLAPRDEDASRALRGVDSATARALIDAALAARTDQDGDPLHASVPAPSVRESAACGDAVREAVTRLLPQVTDPALVNGPGGLVWAVLWAADLRLRREELSRRTALVRAGALIRPASAAPDKDVAAAISGLFEARELQVHPRADDVASTITAVAADGARLDGRTDERTRRLSPPEPPARWDLLLGETDALLSFLVTGAVEGPAREALAALLRTWAAQPFARGGTAWVRGRATGAALAPLLETGAAVITGAPADRLHGDKRRTNHWSGTYHPHTGYHYVRAEAAPVPLGAEEAEPVRVERDEADRIRRFLDLLDQHGPVSLASGSAAVKAFRAATRVTKGTAEFVLSGGLGRTGGEPDQGPARTEYRATGATLSAARRRRILAAALPDDPDDLWRPGGGADAAERMACGWADLLGVRPTKAEVAAAKAATEVTDLFAAELKLAAAWTDVLTDPAGHPDADRPRRLVQGGQGELEVRDHGTDRKIYDFHDHARPFRTLATVLVWSALQAPVGHAAHAAVPELHERFLACAGAPGMYVPLSSFLSRTAARTWIEKSGADPVRVGADGLLVPGPGTWPTHSDGVLVLPDPSEHRPSAKGVIRVSGLFDPHAVARTLSVLDDLGMDGLAREVRHAALPFDGRLARIADRAAHTPVPEGGFEADPRQSVPDLVAEASDSLGVDTDAAALCLQLLTLARPTDRNVRRWNRWSATHHKAVAAELLATGTVLEGRRARAGRTLFVPGGWTELKAPHLPLETAKLATHVVEARNDKEIEGPFTAVLPPAPLHEMFEQAWRESRRG
ncbi:hypothetical protein [Nocardiopsis sp. NRRL B-16309]|uniref:hypothetical protein n=1 Tax=Nocardiopsis sp. NRRL B-16309 TaxID=1519494 RepID=UPI0006AFC8B3|nr:hypothetical protein [Nocardiopsis sp. NRRL B-16309]KOX12507.1 hypothetical protein ADL05_21805 [Nocardiopsis sp. NRRL B-16309]